MSRGRRLLWWLHNRLAFKTIVPDVTGHDGWVYLAVPPHFQVRITPDEATAIAEGLAYQARVAQGEAPPRRLDYREDR